MYDNIRPGLGLQCVIVVFPDHTNCCSGLLLKKNINALRSTQKVSGRDGVVFLCFFF